jgi:hypothetical protein
MLQIKGLSHNEIGAFNGFKNMFVRFLVLTFRLKLETNNAPADV